MIVYRSITNKINNYEIMNQKDCNHIISRNGTGFCRKCGFEEF